MLLPPYAASGPYAVGLAVVWLSRNIRLKRVRAVLAFRAATSNEGALRIWRVTGEATFIALQGQLFRSWSASVRQLRHAIGGEAG